MDRTLSDLSTLDDALLSVAIVPVGVTQFRDTELRTIDKEVAIKTLDIASKYEKVCCSDEFFLLADVELPDAEYYGNFSQLDDGVGSLRSLIDDFDELMLPKKLTKPLRICLAAEKHLWKSMRRKIFWKPEYESLLSHPERNFRT